MSKFGAVCADVSKCFHIKLIIVTGHYVCFVCVFFFLRVKLFIVCMSKTIIILLVHIWSWLDAIWPSPFRKSLFASSFHFFFSFSLLFFFFFLSSLPLPSIYSILAVCHFVTEQRYGNHCQCIFFSIIIQYRSLVYPNDGRLIRSLCENVVTR